VLRPQADDIRPYKSLLQSGADPACPAGGRCCLAATSMAIGKPTSNSLAF